MEKIAIIMENSPLFVECLLDIWNENNCAVLLEKKMPVDSLIDFMQITGVIKSYVDSYELAIELKSRGINTILVEHKNEIIFKLNEKLYKKFRLRYDKSEAVVLFSSGTTGKSKGIVLSHYAIQRNADAIIEYMNINENNSLIILKSLIHSSTLVGELLVGLKAHCKIFIARKIWNLEYILKFIKNERIEYMCLNPSILYLLNREEFREKNYFSNIKKIYLSGSPINKNTLISFKSKYPNVYIYNVYGLTEMGPRVMAQRNEYPIGAVGYPITGVDVKIVNQDGIEVPAHTKGIIHVKSESAFLYYIEGELRESYLSGYFNTGDIGWKDTDGNYFVIGRFDNMIISASYNIYPEEIEETINSFPGILDNMVFGIPDNLYGEKLICYYVAMEDYAEELVDWCKKKMPSYQIPREFFKVEDIMINVNGKKKRRLAAAQHNKLRK